MMVKFLIVMMLLIYSSIYLNGTSYADPVYYKFDGSIGSVHDTATNTAASDMYTVGDLVSYTIMVDTAIPGRYTNMVGQTHINDPYSSNDYGYSYSYYAELIYGDFIPEVNGGSNNHPLYDTAVYNTAEDWYRFGRAEGSIKLGSDDSNIRISDTASPNDGTIFIPTWEIGKVLSLEARSYDEVTFREWSYIRGDVTLTAMTSYLPAASVPEPSLGLLLGISLIGLVGAGVVRRIKQKAIANS